MPDPDNDPDAGKFQKLSYFPTLQKLPIFLTVLVVQKLLYFTNLGFPFCKMLTIFYTNCTVDQKLPNLTLHLLIFFQKYCHSLDSLLNLSRNSYFLMIMLTFLQKTFHISGLFFSLMILLTFFLKSLPYCKQPVKFVQEFLFLMILRIHTSKKNLPYFRNHV